MPFVLAGDSESDKVDSVVRQSSSPVLPSIHSFNEFKDEGRFPVYHLPTESDLPLPDTTVHVLGERESVPPPSTPVVPAEPVATTPAISSYVYHLYLFGSLILLLAGSYLWWVNGCCSIPESDQVRMTVDYAVEELTLSDLYSGSKVLSSTATTVSAGTSWDIPLVVNVSPTH
jgi:hypothetical protein